MRRYVANIEDARHQILGLDLGVLGFRLFVLLPCEIGQGIDPHDVSFLDHAQVVHLQQHVQGLIPRDTDKLHRHLGLDPFPNDDVESADFGDQPEDIADIRCLKVQRNPSPHEAGLSADFWLLRSRGLRSHLGQAGFGFNHGQVRETVPGRTAQRGAARHPDEPLARQIGEIQTV